MQSLTVLPEKLLGNDSTALKTGMAKIYGQRFRSLTDVEANALLIPRTPKKLNSHL